MKGMSGLVQVVLGVAVVTALVCATVLALRDHAAMGVVMAAVAVSGLAIVGAVEMGRQKSEGDKANG